METKLTPSQRWNNQRSLLYITKDYGVLLDRLKDILNVSSRSKAIEYVLDELEDALYYSDDAKDGEEIEFKFVTKKTRRPRRQN